MALNICHLSGDPSCAPRSRGRREEGSFLPGNKEQREAICHFEGPCLVLAGPGSGKTFVLTEHIHDLLTCHHIDPSCILVLTFSRKAAMQMRERFIKGCRDRYGGVVPPVVFGTFHSVFYHILQESDASCRRLIDARGRAALLSSLYPQWQRPAGPVEDKEEFIRLLDAYITRRKCALPEGFEEDEIYAGAFSAYQQYLKENHLLDFDDMILLCRDLLKNNRKIRRIWYERFRFLLVDEFQDINKLQEETLSFLDTENLFAVGDDDQSIYGFRGSSPGFLQNFDKDYPGAHIVKLRINYRSSAGILFFAERVIRENRNRLAKQQTAASKDRTAPEIKSFSSKSGQLHSTLEELRSRSGMGKGTTAVIFRTNLQVRTFLRFLEKEGFTQSSGTALQKEEQCRLLAEITAYLRLAAGAAEGKLSRSDFYMIMNRPPRFLLRQDFPDEVMEAGNIAAFVSRLSSGRSAFTELYEDLLRLSSMQPFYALQYLFYSMDYASFAVQRGKDSADAIRTFLGSLLGISHRTTSLSALSGLLQEMAGKNSTEKEENRLPSDIRVMTMHASKGLEFDCVILPDLNEGIVPSRKAVSAEEIEEERRLLYVAMTRAKKELKLYYVSGTKESPQRPSRFLHVLGVKDW